MMTAVSPAAGGSHMEHPSLPCINLIVVAVPATFASRSVPEGFLNAGRFLGFGCLIGLYYKPNDNPLQIWTKQGRQYAGQSLQCSKAELS